MTDDAAERDRLMGQRVALLRERLQLLRRAVSLGARVDAIWPDYRLTWLRLRKIERRLGARP